jgi:hypothetical protein
LAGATSPDLAPPSELRSVITALQELRSARAEGNKQEAYCVAKPLLSFVPEAAAFERLTELTPEMRLRLFDKLVEGLHSSGEPSVQRRTALALLAGYLATVAAGGATSLALAENHASRWPEITAWAYLIGGIGERVIWTSSFDGLGRLVARELLRPLRLDEPPSCDFALEEVTVLADSSLADPLVHLRIKQARLVTVALFPGVNISIPISESPIQNIGKHDTNRQVRNQDSSARDPMITLADALWPHIRTRLDDFIRSVGGDRNGIRQHDASQRSRGKRRPGTQPQLPLAGDPKKRE